MSMRSEDVSETSNDKTSTKQKRAPIKAERVSKREFILRSARRAGQKPEVTLAAYEAIFGELVELAKEGNDIVLTGFGRFYPIVHAGHPTRVPNKDVPPKQKEPYTVLKFKATRETNNKISGFDKGKPALELGDDDGDDGGGDDDRYDD